jgi:hypothetical protein
MYTKTIGTLALASTLVLGAAAPALAKGRVERAGGSCATGVWKLKAKADNGGLDVEFEIDTNRNGQTWRVRVFDNGTRVIKTRATTHAPSGSFTVQKVVANRMGSDRITARATNVATGKVCGGSVTF